MVPVPECGAALTPYRETVVAEGMTWAEANIICDAECGWPMGVIWKDLHYNDPGGV